MHLPNPGELFDGKYQLLRTIGEGGFARVYQARDTTIDRDVAVKVLTPQQNGYPERVRKRFVREARVIAELHGAHTITMFDYGTSASGLLYMVFEFIAGVDLQTLVRQRGALDPNVVEHILRQMLQGLAEAHALGVLHRDVKPANVLVFAHLDDPYQVKLIDFGIAKLFALEGKVDLTQLTSDGSVIGTPRYLAPEQFFGDDLTPAADLYSCGLVALELLRGSPAIAGDSREEILRNQLSPAPIAVPPVARGHLATALQAMTARAVDARPRSAQHVLRMLDGQAPSGSRSGPIAHHSRSSEHRTRPRAGRATLVVGASLAVAAVGVGAVMFWPQVPDEVVPPPPRVRSEPLGIVHAPQVSADDDEPDVAASDGCAAPATGMWTGSIFRGLEAHAYHVWVPERPANERLPVVFAIHRLFGSDREFIGETRFHEVADEFGFILISMHFSGDPDIEQMAQGFIEAYDEVQRQACVDQTRLFAVGHAGGGRHLRRLRCHLRFSAIASTSDGQHRDESNCPAEPTPFLRIYGRSDPHLPTDGRSKSCMNKTYLTPEEFQAEWRELNRCEGKSRAWASAPSGDCVTWSCEAALVDCAVNGGFDWPHAPEPIEMPGCKSPPMDFPVGRTIWNFFDEHGQRLD